MTYGDGLLLIIGFTLGVNFAMFLLNWESL